MLIIVPLYIVFIYLFIYIYIYLYYILNAYKLKS